MLLSNPRLAKCKVRVDDDLGYDLAFGLCVGIARFGFGCRLGNVIGLRLVRVGVLFGLGLWVNFAHGRYGSR
jgi:hypothetical protein